MGLVSESFKHLQVFFMGFILVANADLSLKTQHDNPFNNWQRVGCCPQHLALKKHNHQQIHFFVSSKNYTFS